MMKLSDFATDLVARNHFVKAGFGGFEGAGKTRTAKDFSIGVYKQLKLSKPILIIDNEKSARFLIPTFIKQELKHSQKKQNIWQM